MESDFYHILGVESTAKQEEIKKRYDFLVFAFHPDRFRSSPTRSLEAEASTKAVNEAFQTLSNPDSRARYDQKRSTRNLSEERVLQEKLNQAQSRIQSLEAELKQEKRRSASNSSKQSASSNEAVAAENSELKKRVRELSARNDRLKAQLKERESTYTEQTNERENEKAGLLEQIEALRASMRRLSYESTQYQTKIKDLREEVAQANRAASLEQSELRLAYTSATQERAKLQAERDNYLSQRTELEARISNVIAEKEQLGLQLGASRASAQRLAVDIEALSAKHERLKSEVAEVNRSPINPLTAQMQNLGRWLSAPSSLVMVLVLSAVFVAVVYLGFARQNGSPNSVTTKTAQVSTETGQPSVPIAVAGNGIGQILEPPIVSAPITQPTATLAPSPTPVPTSTPTPVPTSTPTPVPTPTIWTYPTLAYNYDTRKNEGWELYKRELDRNRGDLDRHGYR